MQIRKATPDDLAVPPLMLQAMDEIIYSFIGKPDQEEALSFMTTLFKNAGNQYSFTNTFVALDDTGTVVGAVTAYDGDALEKLRAPVLQLVSERYNRKITPENETEGNELYLDTVAVAPNQQGKGVGSALIRHVLAYAKIQGFPGVGLLVNSGNDSARRLYERVGFKADKTIHFAGGLYQHMFYAVNEG